VTISGGDETSEYLGTFTEKHRRLNRPLDFLVGWPRSCSMKCLLELERTTK